MQSVIHQIIIIIIIMIVIIIIIICSERKYEYFPFHF